MTIPQKLASKFSPSNLLGIDAVIQAILNQAEIGGADVLIKIPVSLLEKYGLQLSSGEALISTLNNELRTKLKIQNKYLKDTVNNRGFEVITVYDEPGKYSPTNNPSVDYLRSEFGLSLSDLRSYLLLQANKSDLSKLSELHTEIDALIDNTKHTEPIPMTNTDTATAFKNGVLYFRGKEIVISKARKNMHLLLNTLFKEPNRLWNYDEIWVDWGERWEDYSPEKWRTFYNAIHDINEKIAVKTTIDDFLECTKNTVNISKKYL